MRSCPLSMVFCRNRKQFVDFFVGNPCNLAFTTITWEGDKPNDIIISCSMRFIECSKGMSTTVFMIFFSTSPTNPTSWCSNSRSTPTELGEIFHLALLLKGHVTLTHLWDGVKWPKNVAQKKYVAPSNLFWGWLPSGKLT